MFRSVKKEEDIKSVEEFIGKDAYNCPYFYTNLKKYGIVENKTALYIDLDEDEIKAAALLYHDSLHVYYKANVEIGGELRDLVERVHPRTIFLPSYQQSKVQILDDYNGKEVLIMSPQYYLDLDLSMVKNASVSDLPRIAQFMHTFWSDVYESSDAICEQLQERIMDNYGRTKYIESEGEIVACVSSYAELIDFAICGGLLVSDSQRGKNLGSIMLKSIYEELELEGKKPCGIIVEEYSRIFHEKNGFSIVGRLIKYVLKS